MPALPSSTTPTATQMNIALLLIRIASALAFLYHGSAILFGAFGGPGPHGFAAYMHAPDIVGAACGIIIMLGAIFLVHLQHGFNISAGGAEYAITQLLVAFAMLITGGGAYSLAAMLPPALRKLESVTSVAFRS